MIPLAIPDLRGNEAAYLAECVRDNWVSSAGPFVTRFEAAMAAYCGVAHGVATVNGTAALELILRASGLPAGSRVAVPDFTFAATANAVLHAGMEPVFVDIEPATWTMDPRSLARAADEHGVAAAFAVHVLGLPADMTALADVAAQAGIFLFEDAAGAIGARYAGRAAGALGRAAAFSFNGNKTLTAGGGGMIVTDDGALAARARHLSTQARAGSRYVHDAVGFNYRMTNVNAALGFAQFERLDEMLAAKRAIAARYDEALAGRDDLLAMPRPPAAANGTESGCWLYSVRAADFAAAGSLVDHLQAADIQARRFWECLSVQPPYAACPHVPAGVAARLSGTVVSLPCSSHLTADEQARVIDALAAWRGPAVPPLGAAS